MLIKSKVDWMLESIHSLKVSQKAINVWNKLATDCVHASSVNMLKNRIDKYLVRAGYALNSIHPV